MLKKGFRDISLVSCFIACLLLWGCYNQIGIIWDFLFGFGIFCLVISVTSGIIHINKITEKYR